MVSVVPASKSLEQSGLVLLDSALETVREAGIERRAVTAAQYVDIIAIQGALLISACGRSSPRPPPDPFAERPDTG